MGLGTAIESQAQLRNDFSRDELCHFAFKGTPADQEKIGRVMTVDQQDCWQACRANPNDFTCKFAKVEGGRLKMRGDAAVDHILDGAKRHADILRNLTILGFEFGARQIEFSMRNESDYDVKDIQFSCDHIAASGTVLRTVRLTAYYRVPAHTPYQRILAQSGYIEPDAKNVRCVVSGAVPAN